MFFYSLVTSIFESTQKNLSDKYETLVTPAGWTFSIWGVIYAWQALLLIYSLTLLFRNSRNTDEKLCTNPDPVGTPFYITYTISCLGNIGWIFTFDRQLLIAALIFLLATAVSLCISVILAARQFYLHAGAQLKKQNLSTDIWLTRLLVQNGVAFYCAWTIVASLLNLAIVLQYVNAENNVTCAWIALGILCGIELVVFILEVFVFDKYVRYVIAHYVTLVVALSGILSEHYEQGLDYIYFVITLLALTAVLGLARLAIAIYRGKTKPISYPTRISTTYVE